MAERNSGAARRDGGALKERQVPPRGHSGPLWDTRAALPFPEPPYGKLLFVVNEAYFFMSHRLPIARAAASLGQPPA